MRFPEIQISLAHQHLDAQYVLVLRDKKNQGDRYAQWF